MHPCTYPAISTFTTSLWLNEYIDRYHYLGYKPLPGAQLRYFAYAGDQLVGLFGFGASAWKTGPRDEFIGWSREQRQANLRYVINNARFLLLPWIRVHNLASKLLSLAARRIADDWESRYHFAGNPNWAFALEARLVRGQDRKADAKHEAG